MYTGISEIPVHTVDLGQITAAAHGTLIHFQFLVSAVITVRQREVYPLVESHVHRPADQCLDRLNIVVDRIFHILDLAAVRHLPETVLQILFLYGRDVLRHVTVEAVGHILPVGHALHNAVLSPELLHLQTAEILSRRAVDGIKVPVRFLIFFNLMVDVLQYFQCESAILHQRFSVV